MLSKFEKNTLNKQVLSQFLYLFVMDIARLPFHDYATYEQGEPGYALPMLNAYIAAFQEKPDGKISHELVKKIHKIAMSHLPMSGSDEYKQESNNFLVALAEYKSVVVPTYSATVNGVQQFVSQWIDNSKTGTHGISFISKDKDPAKPGYMIERLNGQLTLHTIVAKKDVLTTDKDKIMSIISMTLNDFDYECVIDSLFRVEDGDKMQAKTQELMQVIIDDYEDEMQRAITEKEIIFVICKYIQRITQLHPFRDGNIRTCAILINKLLRDHHLSLSLFVNPNRMDCCTVDELVNMVIEGQAIYQDFLANVDPKLFAIKTNEPFKELKSLACAPYNCANQKIYDEFIKTVINKNLSEALSVSPLQHLSVFSSKIDSSAFQLIKALEKLISDASQSNALLIAIKKGQYSLALRKACAANKPELVETILQFKDLLHIDVNEKSSNGYTALDWFEEKTSESAEKNRVMDLFFECGAESRSTQALNFEIA